MFEFGIVQCAERRIHSKTLPAFTATQSYYSRLEACRCIGLIAILGWRGGIHFARFGEASEYILRTQLDPPTFGLISFVFGIVFRLVHKAEGATAARMMLLFMIHHVVDAAQHFPAKKLFKWPEIVEILLIHLAIMRALNCCFSRLLTNQAFASLHWNAPVSRVDLRYFAQHTRWSRMRIGCFVERLWATHMRRVWNDRAWPMYDN